MTKGIISVHEAKSNAGVAQPGQRRKVQDLISQEFVGSNPTSRTTYCNVTCVLVSGLIFVSGHFTLISCIAREYLHSAPNRKYGISL